MEPAVPEAPAESPYDNEKADESPVEEILELISSSSELSQPVVPFGTPQPVIKGKIDLPQPPRKKTFMPSKLKAPSAVGAADSPVADNEYAVDAVSADTALPETEAESFLSIVFDEEASRQSASDISEPAPTPAAPTPVTPTQVTPTQVTPTPAAPAAPAREPKDESAAEAAEPSETYSAVRSEVFNIVLEGEGWLLEKMLGEDGEPTTKLRFNGREYRSGETVFYFYPFAAETFSLSFRLVDYERETSERKTVLALVTGATGASGSPESIAAVTEAGAINAPETDNPEPQEAGAAQLSEAIPVPLPEVPDDADGLVNFTGAMAAEGKCIEAAALLEERLEGTSWTERDRLYFALAELYQNCDALRDERQAVEYYRQIVDYYPVSNYWTISKERINYLERYFIHIR